MKRHLDPSLRFAKALFAAACLWTVAGVLPRIGAPWAWDDLTVIAYNKALAEDGAFKALVTPQYFTIAKELSWRPASTFLHVVGARAFGDRPAGHRALNLLLHLLAAGLLVAALLRWGVAGEVAWVAGALFVGHPVHLETLFCVSFNEEILVLLGWLGAWLAWMRWREGGAQAAVWLGVSAAAYAVALLSKETGLLGLPLLVLLERFGGERKIRWPSWLPHAAVAAVFLVLRLGVLQGPQESAGFPTAAPLLDRLYFAGAGIWAFLRTAVLPWPLLLEYFAVPAETAAEVFAAAAAWAIVAVAGGVLAPEVRRGLRGNRAPVAAGALWAAFALLPTLNLIPAYSLTTRVFAERWSYVPLAGLCFAAAAFLPDRAFEAARRRIAAAAFGALLAVLFLAQAPLWADETRLWGRLVEACPWAAKANEGLGQALFRQGRYAEALDAFERGLRLRTERTDRVLAYYVPLFESRARAAGLPPPLGWESASARRWLGRAWMALGHPDRAREHFARAESLTHAGL